MCEELSAMREAMARYAGAFDPVVVSDLAAVVGAAAAIESMAATVKALAAARAAELECWKRSGHRSAADALAAATGTSIGAAAETIRTGARLGGAEALSGAARRGQLSSEQVRLIAAAVAEHPTAEAALIATAAGGASMAELREACAAAIAAAHPDPESRLALHRRARRVRDYSDIGGLWHLAACGPGIEGAKIMAAIAARRDELFNEARRQGRHEPAEAYAFDALVALCCGEGPKSAAGRAKIIVRVDLEALLRGYPAQGETCELVGYGPIAVGAIADMIESGDPFLAAVATKGEALLGVAHLGRRVTARQQTALEWLYPSCAVRGCAAQAFLENDHRIDWSKIHFTLLDLMDRLCRHHHRLKTREHWSLVEGRGKRAFVAPDDPRHPRHQTEAAQRVRC